jgi:hypothetical protein
VHFVSSSAGCQFSGFLAAPVCASVLTAAKIVLGSCFCHSAPCVTYPAAGAVSIFFVHTWIHRLQASLSLLFDFLFFSRACRALPRLVPSLICSFVPGLCAAFLGAIFFLASRERRAEFSGLHAARVLRFSGRSRLFHFDFLCICVTQFCGNC